MICRTREWRINKQQSTLGLTNNKNNKQRQGFTTLNITLENKVGEQTFDFGIVFKHWKDLKQQNLNSGCINILTNFLERKCLYLTDTC